MSISPPVYAVDELSWIDINNVELPLSFTNGVSIMNDNNLNTSVSSGTIVSTCWVEGSGVQGGEYYEQFMRVKYKFDPIYPNVFPYIQKATYNLQFFVPLVFGGHNFEVKIDYDKDDGTGWHNIYTDAVASGTVVNFSQAARYWQLEVHWYGNYGLTADGACPSGYRVIGGATCTIKEFQLFDCRLGLIKETGIPPEHRRKVIASRRNV